MPVFEILINGNDLGVSPAWSQTGMNVTLSADKWYLNIANGSFTTHLFGTINYPAASFTRNDFGENAFAGTVILKNNGTYALSQDFGPGPERYIENLQPYAGYYYYVVWWDVTGQRGGNFMNCIIYVARIINI